MPKDVQVEFCQKTFKSNHTLKLDPFYFDNYFDFWQIQSWNPGGGENVSNWVIYLTLRSTVTMPVCVISKYV